MFIVYCWQAVATMDWLNGWVLLSLFILGQELTCNFLLQQHPWQGHDWASVAGPWQTSVAGPWRSYPWWSHDGDESIGVGRPQEPLKARATTVTEGRRSQYRGARLTDREYGRANKGFTDSYGKGCTAGQWSKGLSILLHLTNLRSYIFGQLMISTPRCAARADWTIGNRFATDKTTAISIIILL